MKNLFAFFWLLTTLLGHAQQAQEQREERWWISPETSPLPLRMGSNGRHLDLVNTTQDVVIAHAFGCIVETANGYRAEKVFPERKVELNPGQALITSTDWYRDNYLPKCGAETAKLAVVKITFSNGNRWTLRSGWSRRKP
jgi:hypothetical protein